MIGTFKRIFNNTGLARKIRYSYIIVMLPVLIFMGVCVITLWNQNKRYDDLIDAAGRASSFSLDFKKDFDYETYLVIVESKSFEESRLRSMLTEATTIVDALADDTSLGSDNERRLEDIRKYLRNLGTYTDRIEANLKQGDKYEDNIEIWENDVQIVTSLVRETIIQFIYYEIQDMQKMRNDMNAFYTKVFSYVVIAFALITALVIVISYLISQSITRPVRDLSRATQQVAGGDLSVRADTGSGAELGALSRSFNDMIDQINKLLEQVRTEQESLRKTELELLQAQINPHFLYNTLDTIVWLAEAGDQAKVVSMVGSLSEFFRASLGHGRDVVTIRDELKHVVSYLEIQQVRYQDILEYNVEVPEELYEAQIPKITLQPIVENALYHGIKNKRGKGLITITGKSESGCMYLYVEDNGMGMKPERLEQISKKINGIQPPEGEGTDTDTSSEIFGLSNVNERIRMKFGARYGIHVDSTYGEGTLVTLMLPS